MRAASTWGLIALLCAGCAAPPTHVILLPQARGTGAIEVSTPAASQRLERGYAEAEVRQGGAIVVEQLDAEQVKQRFGTLLAVQPPPARDFTLYFQSGGTDFTPESEATLKALLALARQRPGSEIVIVGHTDRVGPLADNDRLSLQRARVIREAIIADGFDPRRIDAVGRGEREPAIATPDEVAEPRNRRTEVIVR
ncbi:MAG: OmpA family protein [Burkholderiaceae bacterium]